MEQTQSGRKTQTGSRAGSHTKASRRSELQLRTRRIALRVLAVLAAAALVIGLLWFNQVRQIRKTERPVLDNLDLRPSQGAIEISGGEQVIAENDEAALYLDPETVNMRLHDKVNDMSWPLQAPGDDAQASEKALLQVEFIGENGELTEWDTYSYSIAGGTYDLERIENGVRINMHISQGASTRFDDYMPRRISAERYNEFFVTKLDEAKEKDLVGVSEYTILQLALKTAYRLDAEQDIYFLSYIGNPPSSTVKRLIDVSRIVDYTYEDLVADNTAHGITMEERENPEFTIPLEIWIDGADLIARIPASQIANNNTAYQIQNLSVLPNFMMADGSVYSDGWMMVPDGSGALIRFNEADPNYPPYERQLRDSNFFETYYFKSNFSQQMTMPVFGMLFGSDEERERSALAIVEDGTSLGGIRSVQANLSGDAAGMNFNRVFPTVDITQFARINVYGPYAQQDTRYLVSTDMQDLNFQVRYKVFGRGSQYFDMAKAYQQYLLETGGLNPDAAEYKGTSAHLEILGTVDVDKRIVGIPYSSRMSMTSYEELQDVMASLNQSGLLYTYLGAFSGGYNQDILRQAKLERSNGTADDWKALNDYAQSQESEISLQANFSRAADNNAGFVPRFHGITGYDNNLAYIYQYDLSSGRFNRDSYNYVRISPWFLDSIIDGFLADEPQASLLTVSDLGQDFFADYDEEDMLSAVESEQIVRENLAKLGDSYDLVMDDSFMGLSNEASFISSVGRSSSRYASFHTSIPFRQIVLNGVVPFSTETINMSSQPAGYYVLQTAETGAVPQYTISGQSSELMKELVYDGFYSTQYSLHEDQIKDVINETQEIRNKIGSGRLTDHVMLGEQLFLSTYESGVRVLVNYGDHEAVYDETSCPAMGYVILEEGEARS